jgi:hypothetical protein
MPTPDCACIAINGKSGYVRFNLSWVIGRMVRDFESWMDPEIKRKVNEVIDTSWSKLKKNAREKHKPVPERPKQAGLCVSIYKPTPNLKAGEPVYDGIHRSAFFITFFQLGIAAIPCGLFGDWGILMITTCGILLSFLMACLPQWKNEKWACRRLDEDWDKNVALTRGNGSQHAIIILGSQGFLNLEDLAGGQTNVDVSTSNTTRVAIAGLALLWIFLLITAAGLKKNTWFLLAVGGTGILENVFIASWRRKPAALGIPIDFVEVFGDMKVMETLYAVEENYPYLGRAMRDTFFLGKLRPREVDKWSEYERTARDRAALKAAVRNGTPLGIHRYFTT